MVSGTLVLMYHHISPRLGPYTVHPKIFRDQLKYLIRKGYRFASADELLYCISTGSELNKRSVVLTFDDGWLDNWLYAVPILAEMGLPSIFFIVTSWPCEGGIRTTRLGEQSMIYSHTDCMTMVNNSSSRDHVCMRWSELLAAKDTANVSLQSHSHSHGKWWQLGEGTLSEGVLKEDLLNSRRVLEEKTGAPPTFFCWPRGLFSLPMRDLAWELGFLIQFSTLRGTNILTKNNLKVIRRLNVENKDLAWFGKRVQLYSNPFLGSFVGILHQNLFFRRLRKKYGGGSELSNFKAPWVRLV